MSGTFTPFRGLLFDSSIVGDVGAATSPPYDVIDAGEQTDLESGSPYNMVRLLLPDQVAAAGDLLRAWREQGALRADDDPHFYVYEMVMGPGDVARGVIGALRLRPLGDGIVGHEETMSKTRANREALLHETQANLDPIVVLSTADGLADLLAPTGPPAVEFSAGDAQHRLYPISGQRSDAISAAVDGASLAIADGHHRYVTALEYLERSGPGPWDHIMAFVAPATGSGLHVDPIHRVIADARFDPTPLTSVFDIEEAPPDPPQRPGSIVVVHNGSSLELTPRPDQLESVPPAHRQASTAVARHLLYGPAGLAEEAAEFFPDAGEARRQAGDRDGVALLMAPVPDEAIRQAGDAGVAFPNKTTFFMPKPRAGLVIRAFDL